MTKDQKESILVASKLLALVKDDEDKFSTMKKYLHSKIQEALTSRAALNTRSAS